MSDQDYKKFEIIQQAKKYLTLEALNQLEKDYLSEQIQDSLKPDTRQLCSKDPTIKVSKSHPSSDSSSQSSLQIKKSRRQARKYSSSSSSSRSPDRNANSLKFVIDKVPFRFEERKNFVVGYSLLGEQTKRITQPRNIAEKLNRQVSEDQEEGVVDEFHKDVAGEVGLDSLASQSRYFQVNPFEYCYRCKEPGHQERLCQQQAEFHCVNCLSYSHPTDKCTQNACFKCHRSGHRKLECEVSKKLFCQRCRSNGHQTSDCGMIGDSISIDSSLSLCIQCNQLGHINCSSDLHQDTI